MGAATGLDCIRRYSTVLNWTRLGNARSSYGGEISKGGQNICTRSLVAYQDPICSLAPSLSMDSGCMQTLPIASALVDNQPCQCFQANKIPDTCARGANNEARSERSFARSTNHQVDGLPGGPQVDSAKVGIPIAHRPTPTTHHPLTGKPPYSPL